MEQLSIVTLKKFKDIVERILHVPGNYRGGVLEMAVVVDKNIEKEALRCILPQLLHALKQQGTVFRNVRFNYVQWKAAGAENQVCPMMVPMTESFYEEYESYVEEKSFERLVDYLKVFQARAKLIILLTDQDVAQWRGEALRRRMQPFLDKKMLVVKIDAKPKEGNISIHYREF